jgi:hypothetical protein
LIVEISPDAERQSLDRPGGDNEGSTPDYALIESEDRFTLYGCKITRAKLDRLWSLATEGFPPDSYVSIESTISGGVESSVEAKSIDKALV